MSTSSLTGNDLLAWNDASAQKWRELMTAHPKLLQIPCDIYKGSTAGQLLQHIVAAELRYAERLIDSPISDYTAVPYGSAEEIHATHLRAMKILNGLLADPAYDWDLDIEFVTLTVGRRRASRRAVFHHALLHSIRHYAQLATLVRQHGVSIGSLDYLMLHSHPA